MPTYTKTKLAIEIPLIWDKLYRDLLMEEGRWQEERISDRKYLRTLGITVSEIMRTLLGNEQARQIEDEIDKASSPLP
jgi:hypothetical protein